MKRKVIEDNQKLIELAVGALLDKLGPVETNRFLSLNSQSRMDSVKRHHNWQSKLDKEEFFAKVFKS
jgi:hypothetical protein